MKTTSVALGEYYDAYVKRLVQEGRYNNISELVRCGLRLLEEHEERLASLRHHIDEGIESGVASDFDPVAHLANLKRKHHG